MDFSILGPLRVRSGDAALDLGGPAQRGLLALLLASPNVPVADDRLIDELWGDEPPASARHLLQVYVSQLRGLLGSTPDGPRIVREGAGYLIRMEPGELDAERFTTALPDRRQVADGDLEAAEDALARAMRLWRGAPFGDLRDPPAMVRARGESLERRHREALASWIDVRLRLGRHHELVPELFELVAQQPYDEALHGQLMLALYRSGRQAEALATARDLEARLREDLGIDPSSEVRDLYRRILLQSADLALEPPPPPTNLPRRLTSFVGREDELREVAELLETSRLVTLTGPGGIGKTRLAIEAGEQRRAEFPGGVWWVDLAQVTESELVVDALAGVLGIRPVPGTALLDAVARSLSRRTALLLLDNCEHVAGAVAQLVATILQATTAPRVLATSRTPLRVEGERLWTVPPLGLPAQGGSPAALAASDAVRLFLERGRSASPSFRLDEGNAAAIAEVCRKLDGVSLAIEMAAARLPVLTPNEIVRHLDERFAMLELSAVGRLTRHRTLAAAIEASDALLSDEERSVFDRLSVFVGPFDLDAAAAVGLTGEVGAARILAVVTSLVEASLLTPERDGGETRYRLIETLREYGLARLRRHGLEDEVRQRHAEHYLDLAAQAGADLWTPAFTAWMDRLGRRYTELQQALGWSLAHETRAVTLRAAPALHWFWYRRGDAPEAGRWSARMLEGDLDGVPADLLADVHNAATFATVVGADYDAGIHHNDETVRLSREAGSAQGVIIGLWARSNIALARGDVPSLRRDAREALALCDRIGDRWRRSGPLTSLGFGALLDGSLDEARARFEQALPLFRELGDRSSLVLMTLTPLTETAIWQHDLVAAERFAGEAVELGAGTGWEAAGLVWYAAVMTERGDTEAADAAASRALRVALDAGLENWFRLAVRELARSAAARGRLEDTARLLAASRRNMPAYGLVAGIYGPVEERCRAALGGDRFDDLAAQGAALSHDEIMNLVGAT